MRSLFQRRAVLTAEPGLISLINDDHGRIFGYWMPDGGHVAQEKAIWLAGAETQEALDFMANEVERLVAGDGGDQHLEVTILPGHTVQDVSAAARSITDALQASGARLVSVVPGVDGSGLQRFAIAWLPPQQQIHVERVIAQAIGLPESAIRQPLPPTADDHFGVTPA